MKTRYKWAIFCFFTFLVGNTVIDLFNATEPLNQSFLLKTIFEELIQSLFFAFIPLAILSLMYDMPATRLAKLNVREHLKEGEQILLETIALHSNYIKVSDASEGKLVLTNHRILFYSNRWKDAHHPLSIPLDTIELAKERRFLWIFFSFGLTFRTIDGKKEKFVIDDLKSWTNILRQQHIGITT